MPDLALGLIVVAWIALGGVVWTLVLAAGMRFDTAPCKRSTSQDGPTLILVRERPSADRRADRLTRVTPRAANRMRDWSRLRRN